VGRKSPTEDGEVHPKKGEGLLCQGNAVKYAFITQHKKTWPVDLMCRLFGRVTVGAHYRYCSRQQDSQPDLEQLTMLATAK